VIDGCSRGAGGGRRLCKEDVGWIMDLKNFLASWSLRSDMVGRNCIGLGLETYCLGLGLGLGGYCLGLALTVLVLSLICCEHIAYVVLLLQ